LYPYFLTITRIGTNDFLRVRLGIGKPNDITENDQLAHNFVLQNFSPEKFAALTKLFPEAKERLLVWMKA
jgi:peptidyl-tRNA hydrolase